MDGGWARELPWQRGSVKIARTDVSTLIVGSWYLNICSDMCIDMCSDMCIDMCIDMCSDMCIDMCSDMCID